jgi:hypothetical protein
MAAECRLTMSVTIRDKLAASPFQAVRAFAREAVAVPGVVHFARGRAAESVLVFRRDSPADGALPFRDLIEFVALPRTVLALKDGMYHPAGIRER